MDQVTQPTSPIPAPPPVPGKTAPSQTAKNSYFARLFSGRTNRRNYFLGGLLLGAVPLLLLIIYAILGFFIGFSNGFTHPNASPSELMSLQKKSPVGILISIIYVLLTIAWLLFFMLNTVALTGRRLQDLDKSGWYYLLSFIPVVYLLLGIYVLFFPAEPGENKYGPQPLPRANIKEDMLRLS